MKITQRIQKNWQLVVIIILPFFLYFNTLGHDYAADDIPLIKNNPVINHGLSHLNEVLTKSTFYGYYKQNYGAYRPVTMLSFATETQLFGLNPGISHFFNILFYAFTCCLLFIVLNNIIGQKYRLIIFISTLIFIVHPLHVEVVANIKSRDEIFALLFGLLFPLYFLDLYGQKRKQKYLLLSVLCFIAGIFSKENALFFVVVFPVFLYLTGRYKLKQILLPSLAFVLGAGVFLLARNLFLESIPAQQLSETNTLFHANTFIEKLSTGCYIFLFNCKQIIFPYPLSWDYSYNEIAVQSNSVFIILVILLVGVLLYWIVKGLLTKNILPVFGWIFLVALLPYSHLLLKIAVNTADRFLFVPSLILASIPILCYHSLPKNNTGPVKILYIFCISIILLFTYLTINQNAVWKDTLTVFRSGTETAPNSYYTQKCYGLWLSNLADSSHSQEEKTDLYTRAAASFSRSLEIYPEQQDIWYMHGRSLSMTNNYPEAKRSYLISLERFSTPKIESLYNLASLYEIVRNYDSSLIYFQKVARIDSTFNNVYASLGRVYLYKQDLGNSLSYLLRSLKQDSTNFSTLSNTGGVYYYYHDYEKAIGYYLKSVKYNKDFCSNYKNLGACWYQKRNYQTALEYYHLSYKCNPENDVLTIINSLSKK